MPQAIGNVKQFLVWHWSIFLKVRPIGWWISTSKRNSYLLPVAKDFCYFSNKKKKKTDNIKIIRFFGAMMITRKSWWTEFQRGRSLIKEQRDSYLREHVWFGFLHVEPLTWHIKRFCRDEGKPAEPLNNNLVEWIAI